MKKILLALTILFTTTALSQEAQPTRTTLNNKIAVRKAAISSQAVLSHATVINRNEVSVPMDLSSIKAENLEVLESAGSQRRVTSSPLKVTAGVANLTIRRNEQLVVRPKTAVESTQLNQGLIEFPGILIRGDAPSSGGPLQALSYALFLKPREAPLPWDSNLDAYATKLVVGFDIDDTNAPIALDPPVTVEFFPSNVKVTPSRITISRTGTSGFKEVNLSSNRRSETLVTARSDLGDLSCEVEVVARIGSLQIITSSPSIPGFGLGTSELTCILFAEDGEPFSQNEALTVNLSATRGLFGSTPTIEIPAGSSTGSSVIRSSGLGTTNIAASVLGFENQIELEYFFPLALIIATLFGGALGGFGRALKEKVRTSRKKRILIIEGCVVGLLTVAVAMSGFVIIGFTMPAEGTELGVFIFASLSGFYGIPFLDWLAKSVFPKFSKSENDPAKPNG